MKYISTRGNAQPIIAEKAILEGLAPDGGLYVPQYFPVLPNKETLAGLT
ncbi:MAG: threonine synthase, partial [Bacillota bacterium]|nr:threonine synthase [Bacillota bacterium]